MTPREERIRAHVLLEIADDFEEVRQIMIQLRRVAYFGDHSKGSQRSSRVPSSRWPREGL